MKTERMILGMIHTNCYIVYDEETKEAIVVDPATHCPKILDKISQLEVNVKYIVLTHAHSDHIDALDDLSDAIKDAKVCIGDKDAESLNDTEISLSSFFRKTAPKRKADIRLFEGDILKLGNQEIYIMETPGHTKGGISLKFDNSIISGDTLFYESVGRTDFPTGNPSELLNTIKNKLFLLPRDTIVYPGHGEPTTIGHEIDCNPCLG